MTDRQIKTYVSEVDYERLRALAVTSDRSLANLLRLALREFLERQDEQAEAVA